MKYCPRCNSEYEEDKAECADCGQELLPEDQYQVIKSKRERLQEELDRSDLVEVKRAESEVEAHAIRDALSDHGIPNMVRCFEDSAYDGLYVHQQGWGSIEVLPKDRSEAEEIIADLEAAYRDASQDQEESRDQEPEMRS